MVGLIASHIPIFHFQFERFFHWRDPGFLYSFSKSIFHSLYWFKSLGVGSGAAGLSVRRGLGWFQPAPRAPPQGTVSSAGGTSVRI